MNTKFILVICLFGILVLGNLQAEEKEKRVYFIGNSVTDNINYEGLTKLAASRGWKQIYGRHMIPGAPLEWIWDHDDSGFQRPPFGHFSNALKNYQWDVVSLQPFDRKLESDTTIITNMIAMMKGKSPDVQIYIYSRWPRMSQNGKGYEYNKDDFAPSEPGAKPDYSKVDSYDTRWLAKYTGGWDKTNETRDYFQKLTAKLNGMDLGLKNPIKIVPVGEVMYELDKKMKAGEVPGYNNIYAFYKDTIHMNSYGSYLVGCTFFAKIYGESPVGLPTAPYGEIDGTTAKIIQNTVWDVVNTPSQPKVKTKK